MLASYNNTLLSVWPDIPAGQTLWLQSNNTYGSSMLTSAAGFTNAGTLRLESTDVDYNNSSLVLTAGTLVSTSTRF